jgi:DNA-binding response OmpR family regulator
MRILFVETQETFARVVIGAFLKNHEVAVRTTVSGAREELSSCAYDAALVAFEMEDGNGVELVKYIRQTCGEMLVIGISARDEENDWMREAGADDVCNKMNFDHIEQVLEKYTK